MIKNYTQSLFTLLLVSLALVSFNLNAQTTIINPLGDGGFNNGSTFAANGWTVANQGVSPVKWAVGTAASGTTSVGATTLASAAVTLTAVNSNIVVGQIVYGSGIPINTFVSAISGTALTLSQSATINASGVSLGFGAFTGGISVGIVQATTAAVPVNSYTLVLATAPNPNISVGMAITPIAGVIEPNTFVASINGTALGLSQMTSNTSALATAQTLIFSATSSAISGNAAYVSNDNGVTNSYGGYPTARTVYFYRDIAATPAGETAMTLTFDVKSAPASGGGWQVFVAPTSQTVTGTDTQVTLPFTYPIGNNPIWAGATLISFNSNPQVATTKTTAFIPKSFAGTAFRLIFVWTHGTSAGLLPPAAVDNISLTSRAPLEITCANSGLWSQPGTWDLGKVPTPVDTVVLDNNAEVVMIDSRYSGCEDLTLAGTNTLLQFAISTVVDEFTIYNDLNIAASGARFNNQDGTNVKYLKLGHNLDVGVGARFDSSIGRLTLNGSTVQNITVNSAGFLGGSFIQPQGAVSTGANQIGVLNQLEVNNTATAASNVVWNVPLTRIKSNLIFTNARVNVTTGNRFVIGNFGNLGQGSLVCNTGSGFTNGLISKWFLSGNTYSVNPGTEYPGLHNNNNPYRYPFISPTGADRTFYVLPDGNGSPAGEIAVLYTHSNTVTPSLSIADGSYTINNRFEGNYTVSTPNASATPIAITYGPNTTTPTFRIGAYINGAFEALDGSARFMNQTAALAGTHQDGTNRPFVFRTGLSLTDLTAAPIYVGIKSSSMLDTSTSIVSASSGDWNTAATWVGGVVPGCTNSVSIASGHTVTVSTTANTANLVIATGGTLVNNSAANNMTVGCTNNNAAFNNYGTHTMTSGKLFVNGAVAHKAGSFFNQTGGEIIVDSNNNGDAATSVAFGGTSFKLDTSNLNLTAGKITIVDPLVNIETTPISATSIGNFSLTTEGAAGVFVKTTTNVLSTNSFTTSNSGGNLITVGQVVTGHANIPAGTTVLSTALNFAGSTNTVTLSQNVTASVPSATNLNFSSMLNGNTSIVLQNAPANANLAVGQVVSGNGIQAGTTIASIANEFSAPTRSRIVLSLPVSGLATSPITAPETLSFSAVNVGSRVTVLTAANPSIQIGMPVSGAGIKPGTIVGNIEGAVLTLSEPVQAGAPSPLVMSFYTFFTQSSGSFIYASPNHYATGLNHTLQIGDGVSTQNTSIITNGFSCQFQAGGGLLSLGNLTVDAPNGAERFMNVSSNNKNSGTVPEGYNFNVQNNLTITSGSEFRKTLGLAPTYVGGNIINNGTLSLSTTNNLYLGNIINGVLTPSAIPQTISGTGTFNANQWYNSNSIFPVSVGSLTINNTNPQGVTLSVPNFRANSVTLTNGILHTSVAYPIYCGYPDVMNADLNPGTFGFGSGVVGSATRHIDGPIVHANKFDSGITQNRLFPVGKNGKYMPISIASTGGVELMVEAFDTNTGTTNITNASNLSSNRWKATRVGTLGGFTGYNVRLGSLTTPVTAANIIVQAPTESGVYDIVATPVSTTTFDAAHFSIPNLPTIALTTAQTGGFLGNFSFSNGAGCSGTPAPTAVASNTTLCLGQPTTLSLTGLTGADFTYQWQMNSGSGFENIALATNATYVANPTANTSYQCVVTCSSVSGTSNAVAITVSQSTAITTGGSVCDSGVINLSASGSSILNWYDAPTGGNLVTSGTSYSPTVSATTTYYVASASVSTGTPVNTAAFGGAVFSSALFKGIAFNVTNTIKLKTVTVYPKNTAALTPITISLFDASGAIVTGTSPVTFTPNLYTGTVTSAQAQIVTLNYNIPIGNGYRLVATNGLVATTNTLGNSTGAIVYPAISGGLSLTGNVSALNDVVLNAANTTNCFHNLTFDETCESVTRTPVAATVNPKVTPTFTQLEAICSGATLAELPTTSNNAITGTWSPAISNTATTTYTFTPTAGLCATTATMTITVNPNVTPTFTQVAPICSGATLAALPTTSNNSITGTWSPVISTTATTAYTFTPTAGLCATTATMTITVDPNVTPAFTQVAAVCSGTTLAALPITSNNAITGTWSPAISNTATTSYTFTPTAGLCATTATMTITVNPNVTPTFTQVAAVCSGATLSALPLTSTNAITGTWSPVVSNTATTTYTFTPTTGLCATTATMTITVNPREITTFTQVAAVCSGSTLAAIPTTSNNGITGTWSPAISNTATTTYTFTPTAGLCATTATMTITVNPNATPTFTQVAAICSGTTLAALPTTSTNSITGTWSPAINNAATTTYTFTPTTGVCANTATMAITVNPNVTPTFTQVAAICSGATLAALPLTSNNAITGTWSPAINNAATTTYTFTPTTGVCANTATMAITVNSTPAPTGDAAQSLSSTLTVGSIIVSGTGIVWYSSEANAASGTNPLPNTTVLTNTTYYATQTISGCASTLSLAVTITTLLNPEFESVKFSYYPNPVIDQLWISANTEINSIEVYNLIGQRVLYSEPNISDTKIDFVGLPSAIYLVKLHANGVTKDIKVIKK